jgi:hypothetical protein
MSCTNLSINQIVNRLTASPAPMLFPDTCALVDLIRVPFRMKSAARARRMLEAATRLVAQSQTSAPDLWVIVPPLVHDEWIEHSQNTVEKLRRYWAKLDNMIEVAHAAADAVDVILPGAVTYSNQDIERALLQSASDFFNNALFLNDDSACEQRAYRRAINNEAPARKGGGLKDCVIIEHAIELCLQLRAVGFSEKCVFITSNTRDFCEPNSTAPKAPLASQLNSAGLSLTTTWEWTKSELGI